MAVRSLPYFASAQADSLQANPKEAYCSITPRGKLFSEKLTMDVDYGDPNAPFVPYQDDKQPQLKDESGKPMIFNSVVTALNYMARQGWLFVDKYNDSNGSHYLLRRKAE